ncbi:MAG TPA: hypothetical protein VNU84_07680 [Candidatus Acidoferrum sp.]|jgi:hypothetical protein|nr:hypothetical protein [Candidatus Acidoferrum sp.]
MDTRTMATTIPLYQRLDSTEGHRLVRVLYSCNGLPIADTHATAFNLRYGLKGGRRICLAVGSNALDTDNGGSRGLDGWRLQPW